MNVKAMQERLRRYAGPYTKEHVCLEAADMLGELREENERLRELLFRARTHVPGWAIRAEGDPRSLISLIDAALEPRK
jgi:hypothetical protein